MSEKTIMKKILLLLVLCGTGVIGHAQPLPNSLVNPTGTYLLKGEKFRNEIQGNFGEIRVKLISDTLIAIAMYGNKGYPEYSSAAFMDTMTYHDNRARYTSKSDPSCQIVFSFEPDGLNIKQIYTDPASTCGFESGVIPLGFIAKYSSHVPIIQSISRL